MEKIEKQIKKLLLDEKLLSQEELLQAEDYALMNSMPLEKALVFLDIVDLKQLGEILSKIYNVPYFPLFSNNNENREFPLKLVPLKMAEKWKIFPVNYDSKHETVTLAVNNFQEEYIHQLRLLFSPRQIELVVAPLEEIERAINFYYKGIQYITHSTLEIPKDFNILSPENKKKKEELELETEETKEKNILLLEPELSIARAISTILKGEGYGETDWVSSPEELSKAIKNGRYDSVLVNANIYSPYGDWMEGLSQGDSLPEFVYYNKVSPILMGEELPYQEMSKALISAISYLVRVHLKDKQRELDNLAARARYCKLLALRLKLSPAKMDGVIIAAWLSDPQVFKELVNKIELPYKIEEILKGTASSFNIESSILKVVIAYQAIKRKVPKVRKDIRLARRLLKEAIKADDLVLESFLSVLKDEEFLRRVHHTYGRILIVDDQISVDSGIVLRLANDGYEVKVVADPYKGKEVLFEYQPDLIIAEIDLPHIDGLKFCKSIKEHPKTKHIPFIFLTTEKNKDLAAKALKVGADDFIFKSMDQELISLKIQKIVTQNLSPKTDAGVMGSLEQMNFVDLVQILSAGGKDAMILMENENQKGTIYIKDGDIIHAQTNGLSGEEAFYSLMKWETGNFQIVSCSDFPEPTINASTMALLLEGARLADEAREERHMERA